MNTDTIYEETLSSSMMKMAIVLVGAITVTFLVIYIYNQATGGEIDDITSWYWLMMFLIFAVVTAVLTNFRNLNIKITASTITVRCGMFKSIIQWQNVEKCLYDKDSSFGYGGFGLRLTRGHGTWIRALILINRPRIALNLKTGKSKRIVFSTDNPDQIMEIAKQQDISTY